MLSTVGFYLGQFTPLILFVASLCFLWYSVHRVIGLRLPEVRIDEIESKVNLIRAETTDMLDRVDHLCKRWEKRERDAMRRTQPTETGSTAEQLAAIRRQRLNGVH